MQAEPSKRTILPALTGIRGLTIAWMVSFHLGSWLVILLPCLHGFVSVNSAAAFRMDLLFMLSGFLISYVYIANRGRLTLRAYGDFLRLRLIRLYPNYVVAFLLTLCLVAWAQARNVPLSHEYSWAHIPVYLAMLQAWPYFPAAAANWNYPLWFVSALWFAYLFVFPVAWLMIRRLRSTWAGLLWVFAPVVGWLVFSHFPSLKALGKVTHASCEFLCGCALYALYAKRSSFIVAAQKHLDKTALVFVVLSVVLGNQLPRTARVAINAWLVLALPFLLAGTTAETSFTARLLASRPMLWLGRISYSLFVVNEVCIKILNHVLPAARFANSSFVVRSLVLAAHVALILGAAVALYRFVELPCSAALKGPSSRRRSGGPTKSPLAVATAESRSK